MRIVLETVLAENMRYNTQGDWFFDSSGTLIVQSIACGDPHFERLVLAHELIEAWDCFAKGVTQNQVDDFDFACKTDDPGSESDAPYNSSHRLATGIENILAAAWDVDWLKYEAALESASKNLPQNPKCQKS